MTRRDSSAGGPSPAAPSAEALYEAVLDLGRGVHLEMDEGALVARFLAALARLFPGRAFAVRTLDPRGAEPARCYAAGGTLRDGVDAERITIKRSSAAKTRLKDALVHSARIRLGDRWDAPFVGARAGFAVPLVAAGELYGVLDVAYPAGPSDAARDEPLVLPVANHLSIALRNERLYRETTRLRDYQAQLIDQAGALILGVDRQWRITVCNRALCELTGYERDAVIGRDLRDWIPAGDRARLAGLLGEAMDGAATGAVEVALMTRSGPVRTVWSIATIRGSAGAVEAVVAVGQDQTVLLELQRQVIQAEKLATLGQLAAGVVHEINNPLTSITVYADYLRRKAERGGGPLSADDVEKLRRIQTSAERISDFARELVQYARPTGHERERVSLTKVAAQALSFCEHLFDRSGIALSRDLAADLPAVLAVPGQLEQVVINLVTNAAQAIAGAGAGGQVAVRTFAAGAGRVGLSVADSGPGVPAGDRDRIFEPFYTTKTSGQGTGLGLSIARNIVDQHGGEISVSEADAGGALFSVLLPIARLPEPGADPGAPARAGGGSAA